MGQLLDKYGGITETFHQIGENEYAIGMKCDIEPVIDGIKALRNQNNGKSKSGDLYHVARIPVIMVRKWNKQYGVDVMAKENWDLLKRLLNSPEFEAFRVYKGTV